MREGDLMVYTHVAAGLLAGAIAATGAWQVQNWRLGSQIAEIKLAHAETMQAIAAKAKEVQDSVRAYEASVQAAEAASDAKHTKELTDAKTETDRYRACVRSGTCGVRIITQTAACAAPSDVPTNASTGSVGDGAVTLDADAGQRVLDLRESVSSDAAKLGYLQAYARQCERAGVEAVK